MGMERAEFESLITRMEQLAREHPAAYRRRVFGLAALGYGYLLFVVLLLLVLCALAAISIRYLRAAGVKLVILLGALLLAILRALWIKWESPDGERVTRADAPELFQLLDGLRRQLRTPPVHEVLVTSEFNAGVVQVPRLGLFGWHRNYLLVGLPLMKGLTIEQFKSVLAHELGHLSHGHSSAGNRIYRLRVVWARLEATFEQKPRWGAGLIRHFFKWYIPYFNAMSFPFARNNEYEADAASVHLTSTRAAAQALTGVHVIGSFLDQGYWPSIHSAAKDTPQPTFAPYSGFVAEAIHEVPAEDLKTWHETALSQLTSHADTHPSLADRLQSIGAPAEFAPPAPGEGADRLLGNSRTRLESHFDTQWREQVAESWRKFHEETLEQRSRLATLREDHAQGPLDEERSLQLARLEENVGTGATAALTLRKGTLERFPDSLSARFALAGQMLREGDGAGVPMIVDVLTKDATATLPGAQLLRDYYAKRGELASATQWQNCYLDQVNRLRVRQKDSNRLLLSDTFVSHGLGLKDLEELVSQLKTVKKLRGAYLARKLIPGFPDERLYVLGVKSTAFLHLHSADRAAEVVGVVKDQITFPGSALIIDVGGSNYRFGRKLRRVKDSRII
jgi:Zn-dependent protease with chaperone function